MTERKTTPTQRGALAFIAGNPRGEASGYDLRVKGYGTTATLNQLAQRGLVRLVSAPGNMAFPANATYRITNAGRAALDVQ